jgi:hypothetical protein
MINKSTNINKTKESLSTLFNLSFVLFILVNCWSSLFKLSFVFVYIGELLIITADDQQVHQYKQNKRKFKQWWSTIHQYKQNKRKFKQFSFVLFILVNCWPSLFKLSFVLFISVNCWSSFSDDQQFTNINKNKRKFKQWWSTSPPISTKQKKV